MMSSTPTASNNNHDHDDDHAAEEAAVLPPSLLVVTQHQPSNCWLLHMLPMELHVNILTYLRAYDLANSVSLVCHAWNTPQLKHAIVVHTATHVYPPDLTDGFDTQPTNNTVTTVSSSGGQRQRQRRRPNHPVVEGGGGPSLRLHNYYTYEHLRNMELLVVARVLSRPEPSHGAAGYYVSKSWCKTALAWLEVQQESMDSFKQQRPKKKLSKKQQRIRNRRLSDASPPWPNVNSDLLCPHDKLQHCKSNRASRAKRKILDKQAWRVLKKLYPDSNTLQTIQGECVICRMEEETRKRTRADEVERCRHERKRPLSCPLVRAFYTRPSRGVPLASVDPTGKCPLRPGDYVVLPRSWCYKWRKYVKGSSGDLEHDVPPEAPCASALLCDAHRLPLIPPHLESYLYSETYHLLGTAHTTSSNDAAAASMSPSSNTTTVGVPPDDDTLQALRAAGLSPSEVASQRLAMMNLEQQQQQQRQSFVERQQQQQPPPLPPPRGGASSSVAAAAAVKDQLDRENSVVVEILTRDEWNALQKWWPRAHSNFCFSFTVGENCSITWSVPPCRDCDASGQYCGRSDLYVKNRARSWVKKSSDKKRAPASLEY